MSLDASEKARLRELITKRSSAKGQITKFKNYLNSIADVPELSNIQRTELNLKLSKFEALSVRIDDLQNEIEVLNPGNLSVEIDERDNIESDIIMNIATAKTLVEKFNKIESDNRRASVHHDSSCCSEHQYSGLKLPQIQIAKFDGAYFRWLEFHDTFENLIHNNERISPIHKFHYLMSYLVGDAARVISNLEVSSSNYAEAWNILCSRYNNKRILINHHLNALFTVKQSQRESERSLRFLVDHVTKNLRALASLGQPTDKWDVLIIYMLSTKLDNNTLIKWEEYRNSLEGDTPSLDQFHKFLIDRADVLEALSRSKSETVLPKVQMPNTRNYSSNSSGKYSQTHTKTFSSYIPKPSTSKGFRCVICNDDHKIYECPIFKSMDIDKRIQEVNKHKLCSNCLRQGHSTDRCRMTSCRECNKRHNSLLHRPYSSTAHHVVVDEPEADEIIVNFSNKGSTHILLSTALIEVLNPLTQQKVQVRALLDCGSQSTFISNSLKDSISLNTLQIDPLKVIGIGNKVASNILESCYIQINSLTSNFTTNISCLVLQELTGHIPKYSINIDSLHIPKSIILADQKFNESGPIDVLIGADLFWHILGNEQISLGPQGPQLRSTQLGWIVSGPISTVYNYSKHTQCNQAIISNESQNNTIEKYIQRFWELETIPDRPILSQQGQACEQHFVAHTTRQSDGRFCVRLPLRDNPNCLGDTYRLAKRRFLLLERRFVKKPLLKQEYIKFINEYSNLGHLSINKDVLRNAHCYYLCHHAVIKQDSESTKLRVVFDGSAASSSGFALNDVLMVGPAVQDTLFNILIRARQYKFLLTADIEKMYRQVLVDERDRDLQCILWRDNESQPIKSYRLNTLTYGTASASFLSTRCLWQIGEEQQDDLIKTVIQKDFYVDDLITGANSLEQLLYIQKRVSQALETGCFPLRKYKSNNSNLYKHININDEKDFIISESSSTLGLGWCPPQDTFNFPIKNNNNNEHNSIITKRFIMSNSLKIFDPLGILSPVVIQPKILIQKLWQKKLDWDEPVPKDIRQEWLKFTINLDWLRKFHIPRSVLCDDPKRIEVHTYSDASQRAYGACVYIRSISNDDEVTVKLLCAKSKVGPVKPTTIPRLELNAALLSARLCKSVIDSLRFKPDKIIHWCDSSVVIRWINTDTATLKQFVANRICEIVELTQGSTWRYVPTGSNPADMISRGVDAKILLTKNLWWYGPEYLLKHEREWPRLDKISDSHSDLPEVKVCTSITTESLINFERYSRFNILQRAFAYVRRFLHNIKQPKNKRLGILSADEIRESFHSLCIIAQRESFADEYAALSKGKRLSSNSKILPLSPFLDINDNLIRVGGRLDASDYSYEKKHPLLLHANHRLTKLYFEWEHKINLHAGPQLLLATIRETVWPVNGRQLAKRTLNKCVRCRRLRGTTLYPKMGNLPVQRISVDYPFMSVGIDMGGPFLILNRRGRGCRLIKCYLCLFVCMRYKCIHLEAVSDLTKEAFIMTLRRFIARRGKPSEIFCDNGTNFVAAAKDIGSFLTNNQDSVSNFASNLGIKFKFIPSRAAHFGGLWENSIKSAKFHIKRVMGNGNLTFEEISTLFAQVEAILNSRPLCPLSSSPNDLLSLSPGHFILGRPLTALPQSTQAASGTNVTQRKRYEHLEKIRLHFWQRWQKEYLAELQQRTKWRDGDCKLNIGDMVLLAEDNTPPLSWRLGRVKGLVLFLPSKFLPMPSFNPKTLSSFYPLG